MMEIEFKLKKLGLYRNKKTTLGKKMGNNLWIHKDYITKLMPISEFKAYESLIPSDFSYVILRWNEKDQELAFIECSDFDSSHEPLVGTVYRVRKKAGEFTLSRPQKASKNPLIYHHKWQFVSDEYHRFVVTDSKLRSIKWKSILGVNRTLSSKIGRRNFWDDWLLENNIESRVWLTFI